MQVSALWRYPIKSLRGEHLGEAAITLDGIAGDRQVHVRDAAGRVATARRHPRLLGLATNTTSTSPSALDMSCSAP